jgi:hypothetical protein
MASLTYSTTGAKIREDTNLAFKSGSALLGPATGFNEHNANNLKTAIIDAGRALQVDANSLQTTSFTVTASVTSTYCVITIA